MPTTINGIGTWYWGKSQLVRWTDTCEFCGRTGSLRSYDTTLYFVFFFVPLLPLGRKRVFAECASCRKHRAMKLAAWEAHRRGRLEELEEAYRKAPRDAQTACSLLGALVGFQQAERFRELAPELRKSFGDDADVLAQLGLAYREFGDRDAAGTCLQASLGRREDAWVREQLGITLVEQMRPADARRHFQPLLDARDPERLDTLLYWVRGFQAKGEHREALRVLDELERAFPELPKQKVYRKLRRASQKRERSGQPFDAKSFRSGLERGLERGSGTLLPKLVAPGLALLALLWYGHEADRLGRQREVWLLNGLSQPYEVELAGKRHKLRPHRPRKVELAEGEVSVRVLDRAVDAPQQSHLIRTPFLTRPLEDVTFVLNPDQAALLVHQTATYSETPSPEDPSGATTHIGQSFYRFEDVDFVFQEFPESIQLSAGSRVVRTRLDEATAPTLLEMVQYLAAGPDQASAVAYLRRQVLADPAQSEAVVAYAQLAPPEESLPLLRSKVAERPVNVDWHRAYQEVVARTQPEHDRVAEYRGYLQNEPDDADLLYLLGRVTPDHAEAERLFLEASSAARPCAFAAYALAWNRLSQGRYDEGLTLAQRALAAHPQRADFQRIARELRLALGRLDELLAETLEQQKRQPQMQLDLEEVHLLALQGDDAAIQKAIARSCEKYGAQNGKDQAESWRRYLSAMAAYVRGDSAAFAEQGTAVEGLRFDVALAAGRLDETAQLLGEAMAPQQLVERALAVYVAAARAGNAELAEPALELAVVTLRAQGAEERLVAEALQAPPADAGPLLGTKLAPGLKRLVLAAAGLHAPALRPACFELARRLNFDRRPPYLLLRDVLD